MYGRNHLFRNDGPRDAKDIRKGWKFTDVTETAALRSSPIHLPPGFSITTTMDGRFVCCGLFHRASGDVSAFEMGLPVKAEKTRLYRNNHDGPSRRQRENRHGSAILTMGRTSAIWTTMAGLTFIWGRGFDLPGFVAESHVPQRSGVRFQDVTTAGNFATCRRGMPWHLPISIATVRGCFEEMGGAQPGDAFQSASIAIWKQQPLITLRLQGVRSNRAAFGARVRVTIMEKDRGCSSIARSDWVEFGGIRWSSTSA